MALLKYLKLAKDCLPDPKGSLTGLVSPRIITSANLEVQQLLAKDKTGKRQGPLQEVNNLCSVLHIHSRVHFNS